MTREQVVQIIRDVAEEEIIPVGIGRCIGITADFTGERFWEEYGERRGKESQIADETAPGILLDLLITPGDLLDDFTSCDEARARQKEIEQNCLSGVKEALYLQYVRGIANPARMRELDVAIRQRLNEVVESRKAIKEWCVDWGVQNKEWLEAANESYA